MQCKSNIAVNRYIYLIVFKTDLDESITLSLSRNYKKGEVLCPDYQDKLILAGIYSLINTVFLPRIKHS